MNRVNDDAHSSRLENLIDATGDLRSEFFLHLETASVAVDDARELCPRRCEKK